MTWPVDRGRRAFGFGTSLALHLTVVGLLARLSADIAGSGDPGTDTNGRRPAPFPVFLVAPLEDPAHPGLNPPSARQQSPQIDALDSQQLDLGGTTIDIGKIASHPSLLFPFLSPGLSIQRFALDAPDQAADAIASLFEQSRPAQKPAAAPPLHLSDTALQAMVDKAWSRRERWSAFQQLAPLLTAHDPDRGRLPELLREYEDQNVLQPIVDDGFRDSRLWVQLGLAADHVNFIELISRYAVEHPSTRVTTELQFLLDQLVQGSLDTLIALLTTEPDRQLLATRATNAAAYQLVVQIRDYYKAEMIHHHLTSFDDLRRFYDKVRLEILTGIVRMSPNGYRVNDARFLIGAIYWRQGQRAAAIDEWRAMTCAASDPSASYALACGDIRSALASYRGSAADEGTITRLLAAENGRWLSFSSERLRQFGYRFNKY